MMLNTIDPIHPMVGFLGLQVHEGVQGTRKNLLAWLVEKKKQQRALHRVAQKRDWRYKTDAQNPLSRDFSGSRVGDSLKRRKRSKVDERLNQKSTHDPNTA